MGRVDIVPNVCELDATAESIRGEAIGPRRCCCIDRVDKRRDDMS